MQLLRPSLVPEFLRNSSFYLGLNVTEDDEFSIPFNHMKRDTNVGTLADMIELLNTIRFWGSDIIPQPMIDFVALRPYNMIHQVLEPYRADLQVLTTVCHIVSEVAKSNGRLEKAMESGNLEVVQYFHNNRESFTDRAIALAAGKGALDCLQYALAFRPSNLYGHTYDVFYEAVRNGNMDCILFLRQKGASFRSHPYFSDTGGEELMEIAASSGRCKVLKYLHSQGCSIKSAAIAAADAGHFDCLEYAVRQGALLFGERPYSTTHRGSLAQRLARMKHPNQLKLLAQALSRGSEMDEQTVRRFVQYGNWELFKLCVPFIIRPSTDLIAVVVEKGYLACLRHLYQNNAASAEVRDSGVDWITYAAGSRYSRLLPVDIAHLALSKRLWKCLRFLITHDCPMEKYLTTSLVQAGQLKLYKRAVEHGCQVSVRVVCRFAKEGNLELLQHALEHGCERSEEILRAAAQHEQLQCLIYAHAPGCPWQTPISLTAARGAHMECLQYLQAHSSGQCKSNSTGI